MVKKDEADLQIHRAASPLACFHTHDLTTKLLSTGDGTEVLEQNLKPGGRFGLTPEDGGASFESFTVVCGHLRCEAPEPSVILEPGDSVSAWPVKTPWIFRAVDEVRLLYVSSRPVFSKAVQEMRQLMDLAVQVEARDGYTADHCSRIQEYADAVAQKMGLDAATQHTLLYGSFLHDVGKVDIPSSILGKAGPLTDDEWVVMRQHPTFGAKMVEHTFMQAAGRLIEEHHERFDGSGYPKGLQGQEIAIGSQIIAVVDSFDAMTTDRPYHRRMPAAQALAELIGLAGIKYDREAVLAFREVLAAETMMKEAR